MRNRALIRKAIEIHGSQARLAAALDCSQQQISYMLGANRVTAEMAMRLDAATAGAVSKHTLRPDIFGPVQAQTSEQASANGEAS